MELEDQTLRREKVQVADELLVRCSGEAVYSLVTRRWLHYFGVTTELEGPEPGIKRELELWTIHLLYASVETGSSETLEEYLLPQPTSLRGMINVYCDLKYRRQVCLHRSQHIQEPPLQLNIIYPKVCKLGSLRKVRAPTCPTDYTAKCIQRREAAKLKTVLADIWYVLDSTSSALWWVRKDKILQIQLTLQAPAALIPGDPEQAAHQHTSTSSSLTLVFLLVVFFI